MDKKEIRVKCIEFAIQYVKYEKQANPNSGYYKNAIGVIETAQKFENYITNGDE